MSNGILCLTSRTCGKNYATKKIESVAKCLNVATSDINKALSGQVKARCEDTIVWKTTASAATW